jgi:hypothetical protein
MSSTGLPGAPKQREIRQRDLLGWLALARCRPHESVRNGLGGRVLHPQIAEIAPLQALVDLDRQVERVDRALALEREFRGAGELRRLRRRLLRERRGSRKQRGERERSHCDSPSLRGGGTGAK